MISGIASSRVSQDVGYEFTVTGEDVDGDSLTYHIENKPVWASFDMTTGTLTGTPDRTEVDMYSGIRIHASDGGLESNTIAFYIDVQNVNDAPEVGDLPASMATEDTRYASVVSGSDIDGDDLTYSLNEFAPDWLTIDSKTGKLSGTPGSGDVTKNEGLVYYVSDGEYRVSSD